MSHMFFGLKFDQYETELKNSNVERSTIENVKKHQLEFYVELCSQILKRFDFEDDKIKLLEYINPNKIQEGQMPTIVPLIEAFPFFDKEVIEKLNDEWRLFMDYPNISLAVDEDVVKFWNNLAQKENIFEEKMFKCLATYIINLLVLPHSSAAAERRFSDFNHIKNKKRNKLNISTVSALLASKEMASDEVIAPIYEPPDELIRHFSNFKYTEHGFFKK